MNLKNIFDDVMAGINPAIIESATVYQDKVSQYHRRYWGKDMELVVNYALKVLQGIDTYRSPKMSMAHKVGDYWEVEVTWFNLE